MIGREKYLDAIFTESAKIGKPHQQRAETILVKIINSEDIDIDMERAGTQRPVQLKLPANTTTILRTKIGETQEQARLSYRVKNFLIAPDKDMPVDLTIDFQ